MADKLFLLFGEVELAITIWQSSRLQHSKARAGSQEVASCVISTRIHPGWRRKTNYSISSVRQGWLSRNMLRQVQEARRQHACWARWP